METYEQKRELISLGNNIPERHISRFSLRIAGAAGDGLQSTGLLVEKYFNRLGFYLRGFPGTQSTIRGGHVWQHVEFSSQPFSSFDRPVDLLIALTEQTIDVHLRDIKEGGFLLYDSDLLAPSDQHTELITTRSVTLIPVPLSSMAREVDIKAKVLKNTIAIGVAVELLHLPAKPYLETLEKRFHGRDSILSMNQQAFEAGMQYFTSNFTSGLQVEAGPLQPSTRIVISGNELIALAAACSGLKVLIQYPITPASSILTYLSNHAKKYGIVARQAEDELAAITMCIGASYAGARAMTASSGPGLSLMGEAFGYAAMTETPIVVVNAMRAGPSTGVPTKMEQADLLSMVHLSHGESPRLIIAPRNEEEAFELTVAAFNLAEKYQMPAIILSDFALSEKTSNIIPMDLDVPIERGLIWNGPTEEFPTYKRYQLREDGISPRAFPPTKDAMYILVGAEHDESSHSLSGNRCGLPSSEVLREQMFHKRFTKLELLRQELPGPSQYGPETADVTIICWGSTEGAVREAADRLNQLGTQTFNVLSLAFVNPLPHAKLKPYLEAAKKTIMYEVNYTGQLVTLIREGIDWRPDHAIHPLSGETPTPSQVLREIQEVLN